ncbi:MAG: hypothetical protein IRY88_11935 [Rubrobacteraceae bacterium]|nr:hypothetical protein [Rubrobacteraceae bacterium]
MGLGEERARSSIRLSLGRFTTREDVLRAAKELARSVEALRASSRDVPGYGVGSASAAE